MNSLMRSAESFISCGASAVDTTVATSSTTSQQYAAHGVLQLVEADYPQRQKLQQFIADGFARHYQAKLQHFMPHLLGVCLAGSWQAALGIRFAASEPLFTEQYLNTDAQYVLQQQGVCFQRSDIAEIGHLYAENRQALMQLFVLMVQALHQLNIKQLLFAATADLKRMLSRHGIVLREIVDADPACLGDKAKDWGSYYDKKPQVCALLVSQAAQRIQSDPRLQQLVFRHWPQLHALVATLQETV